MTVWIKLEHLGHQSVFSVIGGGDKGRYHFEIKNGGKVRWSQRDKDKNVIFKVMTKPLIKTKNWTHLAVTYDGGLGIARVG